MTKTENKTDKAPCIAILGTGSDVGKSIVVTALCRVLADKGVNVAPFKAQNMSNNSGVTPEGLEMGRAQIVQAEACGIPPHVDMNPILLKPTTDVGAQVVLMGEVMENSSAMDYHKKKTHLFKTACDALNRLRKNFDMVVMEGAGSCAEVNLMDHDIVNLPMADFADAKVIVVGDIHRGGIFAQLVGTLDCLPEKYRDKVAGFIINRFRGDIRLFEDGVKWIEKQTGKPVFGVLPWFNHIQIDPEDSVVIESPQPVTPAKQQEPAIAVIRIPHISNFTDFDPLKAIDGVGLHFIEKPQDLSFFKAVILPGSKNTRFDLQWLKETGWSSRISSYEKKGGRILGICGGYQMMGTHVHDPDGLEGMPGTTRGLSLLPVETLLKAPKTTTLSEFKWGEICGYGYEIHMGRTKRAGGSDFLSVQQRNRKQADDSDGCISDDKRKAGTYMHGLFDTPAIIRKWFDSIGLSQVTPPETGGLEAKEREYGLLASHFTEYIDVAAMLE